MSTNRNKGRLLIVEDSDTIAEVLRNTAEGLNTFSIAVAKSLSEAKFFIETEKFDVAILDIGLPDAPNGEVVDLAKEHSIPAIVLTGSFDFDLREKILQKSVVDYVQKSSIEDIRSAVFMAEDVVLFKGRKALVVDDSKVFRSILVDNFKDLNFTTFEAVDGIEAIEILNKNPDIDIVTVDYEMPHMNGVQLIQQIKQLFKTNIPIIIGVCSSDEHKTVVQFLKSGANDYFPKPIMKEIFNLKIANIMKLLRQQREILISQKVTEEYKKALDSGNLVTKADMLGNITYANEEFCALSGYSLDEMIGKSHSIFRHPQSPRSLFRELWTTIKDKKIWRGVIRNLRRDGSSYYSKTTIVPILDVDDEIVEFVAVRDDVTALVESRSDLKKEFFNDWLTGLGNRHKLRLDMKQNHANALAILDIKGFKDINNSYGSKSGDFILSEVANRLFESFLHLKYLLYRISSDEFGVLAAISNNAEREVFKDNIQNFIENLEENPIVIEGDDLIISLVAGIAFNSNDITNADMALKYAVSTNVRLTIFDENLKLGESYKRNVIWAQKLKNAINNDKIIPFFQPIVSAQTREICKYECLVRMIDEDGNIVLPGSFLDVAKKSNLYKQITLKMIQACFGVFSKTEHRFSINITLEDILDENVREFIIKMVTISKTGKRAIFELVESEGIEGYEQVLDFAERIKKLGCKLSIDDFGTGYSNFDYLMKLKPDIIKIDGSIIQKICSDENAYSVAATIVKFAKNHNCETVAEFVNSNEIYEKAKELGIDCMQGFYFHKPSASLGDI